jgi:CheY-like chemotaxis protein
MVVREPEPESPRPAGWILVLEEDLEERETLGELLLATNLEVVECADVGEAEAAVEGRGKPNVALVDFTLSDVAGIEFVAQLRSKPGFEYVPAVFLADVDPPLMEEVRDPILKKPTDADHLMELIAPYCGGAGSPA